MESSEDDAGNATSASRRASAREKDIGQAEDVEATRDTQHEPPDARTSCRTPAMSEENDDGESVPSPSQQDVNTSTEAILDMIDEFVDGPGAPKRVPLSTFGDEAPALNEAHESLESTGEPEPKQQIDNIAEQVQPESPAPIDKSENPIENTSVKSEECASHSEDPTCANKNSNVSSPQASSANVDKTETFSNEQSDNSSAVISAEPELSATESVSDSPSSSIQTVQDTPNVSECEQSEQLERTVKCVTSSDNRDSVTVERAESTSSECSVSESRGFPVEPQSKSPLKRRLVRPVPSDRRPDSTVSSTVDSQTASIHTTQSTSCDVLVKDVSSSSDAVPVQHVHGKVKPEEISNVSEISICKAETSTAPKKIRLVRPKVTPVLSNSNKNEALSPEKKQCQSTSPDDHLRPVFPVEPTTSQEDSHKSKEHDKKSAPVKSTLINDSIKVFEPLHHSKSEAKENVISNIENTTSVSATLVKSVGDVQDSTETCVVEAQIETEPKATMPEKSEEITLNPIKPVQDCLNPPDIQVEKAQKTELIKETQSDNSELNKDQSIMLSEAQSEDPKPITVTTQESAQTLMSSPSVESQLETAQILAKEVKSTETLSTAKKTSEIQLKKSEKPCQIPDESQSENETTIVKSKDLTSSNRSSKELESQGVEQTQEFSKMPTDSQAKVVFSDPTGDSESNKLGSSMDQSKLLELSESKSIPILEPTVSQIKVSKPEKNQQGSQDSQVPPDSMKATVTQVMDLKPVEVQLKATESSERKSADSKVPESLGSQPKAVETTESHPKLSEPTVSEVLEQEKCQSKVLQQRGTQAKVLAQQSESINAQSELLDQTQSQTVQTKSIAKDVVSEVEDNSQLMKTSVDLINKKVVLTGSNKLNEKDSVDAKMKNSEVYPKESQTMDIEPETLKKQSVEVQSNALDGVIKLPPIKLTLTKASKPENDTVTSNQDKQVQQVSVSNVEISPNCVISSNTDNIEDVSMDQKKVKPIKLNLSSSDHNSSLQSSPHTSNAIQEKPDSTKQVPKLTIKLGNKQVEEIKPSIPKLTIKPIRPPVDQKTEDFEGTQQIPNVTKLNIKPIIKPRAENISPEDTVSNDQANRKEKIPSITKLNIKPIPKPAEKINDMHRKSSSSEISESEYSENDETSTSDQASASDQGPSDTVPKVTIKLGKPGTECEGKFYTEKNIPKLTIKGLQQNENDEKDAKLKLVISQSEDSITEKIPKLTIKTVTKSEAQPLSPKLTIKPIKPPENDNEIPKLKITTDAFGSCSEIKENMHVPKLTIKAVTKTDTDTCTKIPKKSTVVCDSPDHIPIVTKLNIKPISKPAESEESSEELGDKVPVVSKLNIKPIVKPKDNEVDSSVEDVPKIIKLNIKPLKNPEEENSSEGKDCDENVVDKVDNIPIVTKLNIKPIIKPEEEDEGLKDSENQSSETGTSSDDNSDHIPVVTKLNIKPIIKPSEKQDIKPIPNEQSIPVVTKLNIKPLVKPDDNTSPSSPKRDSLKSPGGSGIPNVTKLNIKPIIKHEDSNENKINDDNLEKSTKNPPLVMKINMKNVCDNLSDIKYNSYVDGTKSPRQPMSPRLKKSNMTPDRDNIKSACVELRKNMDSVPDSSNLIQTVAHATIATHRNCLPEINESKNISIDINQAPDKISSNRIQSNELHERKTDMVASPLSPGSAKQKKSLQNCTLLKQLLSNTKDDSEKSREMNISNCSNSEKSDVVNCNATTNIKTLVDEIRKHNSDLSVELGRRSPVSEVPNDLSHSSKTLKIRSIQDIRKDANESVTKPLEIVTDKVSNQSSGQDSPRIILKINKTDHGPSSKIITEECHRPKDSSSQNHTENTHETSQEKLSPKKQYVNSRKKQAADEAVSLTIGKRLRSSRVVETPEKTPIIIRRNAGKRPSVSETSPSPTKETEISVLDSKRLKLEQILSVNKGLTITPVASNFTQTPPKPQTEVKPSERKNFSLLNNDNSKNGNSKLHNILSNLQAKQMQSLQSSEASILNKDPIIIPDAESNTSTGSSDVVVEISRIENCHPNVQEMIISENSEFRDISTPDEISQDPLEVDALKSAEEVTESASIKAVEVTPTPRKRGRPRKIPLSEGAKPVTPASIPTPALEERPQRSLRLMRERPTVSSKPRGRGRGRGGRRAASPVAAPRPASDEESTETVIVIETLDEDEPQRPRTPPRPVTPEDPTSSRIKLPRMTEALDKSSACITPLSSRRRSTDMKMFSVPSVVLESPIKIEEYMKSPDAKGSRGRGGRGRTPRGRTPRGRGRGRGGGKGATYMKETMGIYGRVCGPATTTVELFEEETCMMDDNATPSKPSHLLDEDSQSSVKSSTNEGSNKMKKSKFADLFDSNKVWTAADVKEYTWPPNDVPNVEHQVMMIQEQVAMFLGVKSFKRRYAELKRRAVIGEEKDYCLRRGIVTEALCDLGITAVDASDVLDIMLSDYPHKYEEYRSYQRQRQLTESMEDETKLEEKPCKIEMKSEKTSDKPEPPKVDPEKTRQDMAAAAIASAAEWNATANFWRRGACADLQSNSIHRRRPPITVAREHCRPPHGFYPHALLPGQYQHSYVRYTPEQLRYFPLNTVIAAPPAPPSPVESSSESEGSWDESSSSSDDSHAPQHSAKRKKLTKVKRSSQHDKDCDSRGPDEVVDLCRVCKLRLEANRKYTHERFLVCAQCNAKFHPMCVELSADTIRKCREYAWSCADCKRCSGCERAPSDKMAACELCDRAFHLPCAGLTQPPTGRWHCVECAICKSCGARSPGGAAAAGDAEWHHQTRRGPGGHKVYSHSLCSPCARAYRIGRYCPLCERSFIGPKGTMQLVICKLCDRQLHQECVRATVSSLNVLDYRCGECRRGGITSRAGAVRAAPRTIATLFMAKRRFNKYAHKQYMQSRVRPGPTSPERDPLDPENSRTDFGDSSDRIDSV